MYVTALITNIVKNIKHGKIGHFEDASDWNSNAEGKIFDAQVHIIIYYLYQLDV